MSPTDLHADAEEWPDNGENRPCEACGGPRVVFIPVWANGSGILTADEIAEVLDRAKVRIAELGEADAEARKLSPTAGFDDDVVMTIEGFRDGTFRAVILARPGAGEHLLTRVQYGRGSRRSGVVGWRHGLSSSTHVTEVTSPQDTANGVRVFEGENNVLNFTWKSNPWKKTDRVRSHGNGIRRTGRVIPVESGTPQARNIAQSLPGPVPPEELDY